MAVAWMAVALTLAGGGDRTAPRIELSGPLASHAGGRVARGDHRLDVCATDRDSGVVRVTATVDGERFDARERRCPRGGCSMRRKLFFRTTDHPGGDTRLVIRAFDRAGNHTRRSLRFRTPCCIHSRVDDIGMLDPRFELRVGRVDGQNVDILGYDPETGEIVARGGGELGRVPSHSDVVVGDVTGDRLADVVAHAGGRLLVALSDGLDFDPPVDWGPWPAGADVQLASLHRRRGRDIVGRSGETIRVLAGRGERPRVWGRLGRAYDYRVGDVSGDGVADLIALRRGAVYVGRARHGAFGRLVRFGSWRMPGVPQARDMHGDRRVDLVAVDSKGTLRVAAATRNGFEPPRFWGHVRTPVRDVAVADFDLFGTADVLVRDRAGRLSFYSTWSVPPTP
jgi:hypothetical protein